MDPLGILNNTIYLVQQAKSVIDLRNKNKDDLMQIKSKLDRIEMILSNARHSSSSIVQIVEDLVTIIGDESNGLTAFLFIQEDGHSQKSLFGMSSGSTPYKKDLKQYNKHLDRIITDLNSTLSSSSKGNNRGTEPQNMEEVFQYHPLPLDFNDHRCILGKGNFATIYKVLSKLDHGLYALKKIEKAKVSFTGVKIDDFLQEIQILLTLIHPNIIRHFLSFESTNHRFVYLVMELATGGCLAEQIKLIPQPSNPVLYRWLKQSLSALVYLHESKHLLHHDLKPENILLTIGTQNIRLSGFGVACDNSTSNNSSNNSSTKPSSSSITATTTSLYASYERLHGLSYDGRDDVWALGCIFIELLTHTRLLEMGGGLAAEVAGGEKGGDQQQKKKKKEKEKEKDVQQRRKTLFAACQKLIIKPVAAASASATATTATEIEEGSYVSALVWFVEQALQIQMTFRPVAQTLFREVSSHDKMNDIYCVIMIIVDDVNI